jgi:hypothetical protein
VSPVYKLSASSIKGRTNYGSMLAGNTPYVPNDFESIATASGTGSSGTITFSNIPGTYRHLQIRYLGQTTRGTYAQDALGLRLNGDSGSTYSRHLYRLNEVSTTGTVKIEQGNQAEINFDYGTLGAAGGSANFWAVGVIDILDYKDTNKHKTVKMIAGTDSNGTVGGVYSVVGMYEGTWRNTNAITSIDFITPATGANFVSGTKFYLYGIRG